MYDEIEIREIIFNAQSKLDKLFVGLKVVVVEDETVATEKDVVKALNDRQKVGFSANDNIEYAPYYIPDHIVHSRPNWLPSSRNSDATSVFSEAIEPSQTVKRSSFRRLYEQILTAFKSYFNKPERKQAVTSPVSKHRNSVSCRIFKDGISL
jgi:hypothetical protein